MFLIKGGENTDILKRFTWIFKKTFKWAKVILIAYIGIVIIGNALPIGIMFVQKGLINEAVTIFNTKSLSITIMLLLMTFILLKFNSGLFSYIDSYFAHKFIQKITFVFNKYFLFKTYKQKQDDFFDPSFNDIHSRAGAVVEKIPFFIFNINEILISAVVLIFQLSLIVYYEPYLLIYFACVAVLKIFSSKYFSKKDFELSQKQVREQRREQYYGSLLTSRAYAKELRIFQLKDYFLEKWKQSFSKLIGEQRDLSVCKAKFETGWGIINFVLENSSVLLLIYSVYLKRIDVGTFVLLYNLLRATVVSVEQLVQNSIESLYNDSLNIKNYIDYVGDIDDQELEEALKADELLEADEALKLGSFQKLEVRNVSYKYPTADRFAVDDVSLTISKGEIISILGYNGSGKTTLSRMISGIYTPDKGQVLINDTDISMLNKNDIYRYFGNAFQGFARYSLSLKENIGLGFIEKYNDNQIHISSEKAGIEDFSKKLTLGYDTVLGKEFDKNGQDLSGGEWQKISLARAYMGEHEILILDEPTASIDPIKEMELLVRFKHVLNDKTAILISHRIGFARLADRIIMMENGKITEQGTHEELLSLNGYYARMFNAQKSLYSEEAGRGVKYA